MICLIILFRVKNVGYHLNKKISLYIATRHFLNSIRKSILDISGSIILWSLNIPKNQNVNKSMEKWG